VESDIHQYYDSNYPGQVVVLGADLFNCTPSQLGNSFAQPTGATYPLLLNAATSTGGSIWTLYGERDHYVVISKQGIVRYQGNDRWPYGQGYHLDEIRGCVDSLVSAVVGVGEGSAPGVALRVGPSPFRATVTITLANSTGRTLAARVTVHDLAGRLVATLHQGPAAPGLTTLRWDSRDREGRAAASGVYELRATIGGTRLSRRIALLR
jgi:hypothetical protein